MCFSLNLPIKYATDSAGSRFTFSPAPFATLSDAFDKEVAVWGRADLKDVDDSDLGLKGSPTKIAKASDKVAKGAGEKVNLDPAESVAYLIGKFKEKHII